MARKKSKGTSCRKLKIYRKLHGKITGVRGVRRKSCLIHKKR
jgi:hypothetical protein